MTTSADHFDYLDNGEEQEDWQTDDSLGAEHAASYEQEEI